MKNFLLSIVIPSYNEMANLQKGVLDKVEHHLRRNKYKYEVVVVDDGSTDGSREFVKEFAKDNSHFKLIEGKHTGKAGAVTEGVLAATGDYIIFTDMDQAVPIEQVQKLLPFIEEEYDVVIGSRMKRQGAPLSRKIMSQSMILLRSFIVGLPSIHDTQCGFKMFKKEAGHRIFSSLKKIHHGFHSIRGSSVAAGFDIEVLYIAQEHGYTIKELPVNWLYVETRRVSPIKDSVDGFLDLLKIKKNIMNGLYSQK